MDKQNVQTTVGFILIALVLMVWMWRQAPSPQERKAMQADTAHVVQRHVQDTTKTIKAPVVQAPANVAESGGKFFSKFTTGRERILIIKTDLYTAEITTKGGLVRKWELKEYKTWNGLPVQLVDFDAGGDLSLLFTSSDGRLINTRGLYFSADYPAWKTVELKGDASYTVDLVLPIAEGQKLTKHFTFSNGKYSFETEYTFENLGSVISNFEYQVVWEHGLRYAEHNSVDESGFAAAYAYSGGELAEIDASSVGEQVKKDINGTTSWVATRNKYFAVALLPANGTSQGAYLEGSRAHQADKGEKEVYSLGVKMPLKGGSSEGGKFTVFIGPLDFNTVKSYGRGLEQTMSLGAAWVIRPIAEYFMIPLFEFLHKFIPNYGIVLIVFSIIIKMVLHPLTKSSMKSMKKMQQLQPMMTDIREKYKDDPQRMNAAVMNLYKEYGVNPAGGCLPLLLQMPILYALWAVFRSSIGLRQAGFMLWMKDLSIPDVVATLPFQIPFFGISELSGLALAMGVTMFVQQKMTVTDPRQKQMVYLMPILMTLMFNSLPSGLNLYYFTFNILSIGQQMWINKQHGDEPLRKVDPKKQRSGIFAKLAKDLPKLNK